MALRWLDVDLDRQAVRVLGMLQRDVDEQLKISEPKSARSRRQIELSQVAVDALLRHHAAHERQRELLGPGWNGLDMVFPSALGRLQDGSHLLTGQFHPLLQAAGLPTIRFHELRHTAATLLLERGVHPKIVSEMLGHSTVAITLDLYSHVTPTIQHAAAIAMDDILRPRP